MSFFLYFWPCDGYGVSTDTTMQHMSDAYTAGELSEADYDDAVDVVMEEESTAGKSMLEGDPLSRQTSGDGVQYFLGKTENNQRFVVVEEDILDGVPEKDWVDTVKKNLSKKFPNGITVGNDKIKVNAQTTSELTNSDYSKWLRDNSPTKYADKFRATNNADELIAASSNWIGEGLKHPRKDNIKEFARGTVLMRIGKNDYSADVVVGTTKNGSMVLYDIVNITSTTIKEKSQAPTAATSQKGLSDRTSVPDSKGSVHQKKPGVKMDDSGVIPHEQFSYTGTPESGIPPVDEGYWNSIMEQGKIPFNETQQPGYSEALLADVDQQNPYAGRSRDVDPSEYMLPDADTVQQAKAEEPSVEIDNLPTKAAAALKKAEKVMARTMEERLHLTSTDHLPETVRKMSEQSRKQGMELRKKDG